MYTVILDGQKYTIHEDLILKYDLLLKKEFSQEELLELEQENLKYQVYEIALKMLKARLRSKKELNDKLVQKGFSIDIVDNVIILLENRGYLNDSLFLESYIHDRILFSSDGPLKIKRYLLTQSISGFLIDEKLSMFTEKLELERLEKIIQRQLKINRKSLSAFQLKMKQYCSALGYHDSIIASCLNNCSFDDSNLYEKEYNKLYKKLSSKYEGSELEYKIKQRMYQKGFHDI